MPAAEMDVLSDVLKAVRLDGALFFHGEFTAPWCLQSACAADAAPYLGSGSKHLIIYHYLREGRAYARLHGGERVELTAGDILMLPHGDEHFIGNGSPERPVDSFKTFAKNLSEGLKAVQFGGGGEVTRFVCGFLTCEPHMTSAVLSGLPSLLRVPVVQNPADEWLAHAIGFSVGEGDDNAGSGLVHAKLSEVLFVETLRRYINTLPVDGTGWLAGARDPGIGQALAYLHKEPEHPWTISDLARRVGLSRTRLAERFRHFLGESPMAYLAQWRLKLGAQMLQSSEDTVAEVAAAVGYSSESAFNRAFKREFACPPAQFRRRVKA
jgi:AraC-like DNA-binding protein